MTREIKFRAWDFQEDKMIGWDELTSAHHPFNYLSMLASDIGLVAFMQFTGLKDKNGKEIYEGDILEIKDQPQSGDFNNAIYVFESRKACFIAKMVKGKTMREETLAWMFDNSGEIIGNIYENPDLLT